MMHSHTYIEHTQYSRHGESLKSRTLQVFYRTQIFTCVRKSLPPICVMHQHTSSLPISLKFILTLFSHLYLGLQVNSSIQVFWLTVGINLSLSCMLYAPPIPSSLASSSYSNNKVAPHAVHSNCCFPLLLMSWHPLPAHILQQTTPNSPIQCEKPCTLVSTKIHRPEIF